MIAHIAILLSTFARIFAENVAWGEGEKLESISILKLYVIKYCNANITSATVIIREGSEKYNKIAIFMCKPQRP